MNATGTADTQKISPLRIPIFRAVWFASMASNFGGLIQSVGAAWMMTSLAASPQMIALVQASTTLPIMLLSLWAGAIADNLDRRKVMLWAQVFMLILSATLAICTFVGAMSPWALLGFTFLIGCGTAVNGPAWQASVGDMVPRHALPDAVALNSMGFNIARSTGPALGGIIVATLGSAAAFLTNTFSYIALIAVLARWRPEPASRALPRERLGLAMAAGLRYVEMSPNIRVVLFRAAAFGLAASGLPALMPLISRDLLAGGALTFGLLSGAFGMGAVGGALMSRRLRGRFSTEHIVRSASLMVGFGAAGAALSPYLPLTMVALLVAGAGWVLALSTFNVTVQMSAPRWVVARALALYQMAAFGGMAAGSWLFGMIAESDGPMVALFCAAALQVAGAALGFRFALPAAESLNLDPQGTWSEPATAIPVEGRSGPIVVTIDYRIARDNIVPFLNVMNERRRIRRRDGARNWTLLRDLADPELWIERYHVATWVDYIRHNQRRTNADRANLDAIRALHEGPEAPRVHRMIERQTGSLPVEQAIDSHEMSDPLTDPTRSS